jgi:23S rRNA maturation mini-RNase III
MNLQEARTALIAWQNKMSAYYHAMSAIYYDGDTVAPKGTAENRAHTLGILSEESYKISTSAETLEMLEFLDAHVDELDEKELYIVQRGKNSKHHTVPKNADVLEYKAATAFEALLGYLYVIGEEERLAELLKKICIEAGLLEKD